MIQNKLNVTHLFDQYRTSGTLPGAEPAVPSKSETEVAKSSQKLTDAFERLDGSSYDLAPEANHVSTSGKVLSNDVASRGWSQAIGSSLVSVTKAMVRSSADAQVEANTLTQKQVNRILNDKEGPVNAVYVHEKDARSFVLKDEANNRITCMTMDANGGDSMMVESKGDGQAYVELFHWGADSSKISKQVVDGWNLA